MNRSALEQFFTPYADEPESFRRLAITIQAIAFVAVFSLLFLIPNRLPILALVMVIATTILLSLRGILWPGQIFTPLAIAIVSTIFMVEGSGVHDIGILALMGSVVVAGLLLGIPGLIGSGVIAIVIFMSIGIAELTGRYVPPMPAVTTLQEVFIIPLILGAVILSMRTLVYRLRSIANKAHEKEQAQAAANEELLQLKNSLERRVTERTADLTRRAAQMETVSTVARAITSVQDLDRLLPSIAAVVSRQFGFYHTGIFLLDDQSEYAVLQATNSPGGQRMLERGHRLRVGATGIVGYVAAHGEARIALDVGADAVFFNNPDLPTTRSEAALPLKVGSQTIGVLDVQSEEVGAFQPEDVNVLSILANQISVAIENARLFSQTRQALTESQAIYEQYVKQDWARFSRQVRNIGYTYDGIKIAPLVSPPGEPDTQTLQVPVKIRGLVVGFVNIRANDSRRQWTSDELHLIQSAAERAGLAIENVRLLNEAQRRASKERTIGEIASRIGASIKMDSIMQTAVEELGRALPGSEIVLQFQEKS